jgi:histidyl-tRNA synthetase
MTRRGRESLVRDYDVPVCSRQRALPRAPQFGAETIGRDPAVDAELIGHQSGAGTRASASGLRLLVNSIGDGNCRPAYLELLVTYLDKHADELCDECRERRDVNPLRTFDCKEKGCRAIMASAPKITDHLCDDCAAHFADVRAHLDARRVSYAVDPGLVRGLDYYTRTAWEWRWPELGAADALSGGGPRDGLESSAGGRRPASASGGRPAARPHPRGNRRGPASGASARLRSSPCSPSDARPSVHAVMDDVGAAGVRCDAAYGGRRGERALELADRRGIPTVVVVGDGVGGGRWRRCAI